MGRLIKENWLWIVVPIVVVLAGIAIFIQMTESNENAPFDYPIF